MLRPAIPLLPSSSPMCINVSLSHNKDIKYLYFTVVKPAENLTVATLFHNQKLGWSGGMLLRKMFENHLK